ncbi:serine/arginine repetitive matrix protein 1 isoform X1 [Selaginella moellendorffii]|uniref:serine/arginine repetitive matrix protein 1 isoform X1 n=1 Tax=Selaginella moellendorffii TaxID=88036 RepID=UPI000D1C9E58|nr:serine/arginine repetitive matrix protein 1 isoform X1 [Selaginella moellendorffii]|eukprot:XP_024531713.1 serine/arginine repetitive matrix protein 1 isoform X1 [Selaginella moellendorffii]
MEERPCSSSEELLPRPLTRLRTRFPSPPPSPLLLPLAPSPPPESPTRLAAPLAMWEREELGGAFSDGSLPQPGSVESSLPRLGQLLGVQRIRACEEAGAILPAAIRRVSWGDHRRELFACEDSPGKVCSRFLPICCPSSSPSPSSSPRNAATGREECDGSKEPGWTWKAANDPDEVALANLFSREEEEHESQGGGDGGNDSAVSVCSSGGGWKADFSSHFKSNSSSSPAVPPLARITSATSSPSSTSSPLLPRAATSSSPKKSPKVVPAAATSPKKTESPSAMPGPPNIRSAIPTPRSATQAMPRDQSSSKHMKNAAAASASPDTATDKSSDGACSEHRIMDCSCCGRKDKSHLSIQAGVERELHVEGPVRKRLPTTTLLTGPPGRKPPMRFGLGPAKSEFLNRAAAMNNAAAKARFTVLPVVTLSKASKQQAPQPRRERPLRSSRLNPEFKGGWAPKCSSVLPRPHSCQSHRSHDRSHDHSHSHGRSVPSPPELDLATPSLNSTARLMERLEEAKREKFDPRAVLEQQQQQQQLHQHQYHHDHDHGHCSDAKLAERYKDLCKISDGSSPSHPRVPRKHRRERVSSLNFKKPEMSDLWVPSEQCPQVCSTAPIRIEPPYWLNADKAARDASAKEAEREVFQSSRNAMSLYGFPCLF